MPLIISLFLNLFFFICIIFLLLFGRTKYAVQIIFLKSQLELLKSVKGTKKLRSTVFQKIIMALAFVFLKCPNNLCYAFTPETILKWYRNMVKKFWTYVFIRNNTGRPPVSQEIIELILRIKHDSPDYGCRRIHGELKKLSIFVSKTKIADILIQHGLDPADYPGETWAEFLKSHIHSLFTIDFKIVTSLFGKVYYVLFFISHHSRKIIHFNLTEHPTTEWLKQQFRNFTFNLGDSFLSKKVYLIHDNDQLFSYLEFSEFNIEDHPISFQSPNMNAVAERFIGSFDHEALDHFVILNLKQLKIITAEYVDYYNNYRPHQGIGNITIPEYLNVNELKLDHKKPLGEIVKKEFFGGILNHYYYKASA